MTFSAHQNSCKTPMLAVSQIRMFLHGPDKQVTRFALGLNNKIYGYCLACGLNSTLPDIFCYDQTDPLCSACGGGGNTISLLRQCCAVMLVRNAILKVIS